jgi:hypothetical protein
LWKASGVAHKGFEDLMTKQKEKKVSSLVRNRKDDDKTYSLVSVRLFERPSVQGPEQVWHLVCAFLAEYVSGRADDDQADSRSVLFLVLLDNWKDGGN